MSFVDALCTFKHVKDHKRPKFLMLISILYPGTSEEHTKVNAVHCNAQVIELPQNFSNGIFH